MKKLDYQQEMTEDHYKELDKWKSFDHDKIAEQYNGLCTNYDNILNTVGWPDPLKCAEFTEFLCPKDDTSKVNVLDMGCGTGLVG